MKVENIDKATKSTAKLGLPSQPINTLVKVVVFVLLAWVVYRQILARDDLDQLWQAFQQSFGWHSLPWLLPAVLLMPVNWAFETLKWRTLIQSFEDLTFFKAYRAVFSGVTFSVFTPNRVGEYGGRILFLRPEHNWKGVIATLVGSYAQLMVLMGLGLLGLIFFAYQHQLLESFFFPVLFFLGFALMALMLFCFFNIDLVVPIARRIPWIYRFRRFFQHVRVLKNYTTQELQQALVYALGRYVVYALQYYLLIRFFGIDVHWIEGMAGIATIYLLQTSIPLPPLMGLLVRGEVALFVWGLYSTNELAILAATFGLWILNLIVPAFIGSLFMLNINVLKSLGYEKKNR